MYHVGPRRQSVPSPGGTPWILSGGWGREWSGLNRLGELPDTITGVHSRSSPACSRKPMIAFTQHRVPTDQMPVLTPFASTVNRLANPVKHIHRWPVSRRSSNAVSLAFRSLGWYTQTLGSRAGDVCAARVKSIPGSELLCSESPEKGTRRYVPNRCQGRPYP